MENRACEARAPCPGAWPFVESLPTLDLEDGVTVPPRVNVGSAGPSHGMPCLSSRHRAGIQDLGE